MATKKKTKTPTADEFQKRIQELNKRINDSAETNGKLWEENHAQYRTISRLEAELYRRRTLLEKLRDCLRKWLGVPDETKEVRRVGMKDLKPVYFGTGRMYINPDVNLGDYMQ